MKRAIFLSFKDRNFQLCACMITAATTHRTNFRRRNFCDSIAHSSLAHSSEYGCPGFRNRFRSIILPGLLVVLACLFQTADPAHAQQITTYADRDSVRIGDTFQVSYVVKGTYDRMFYPDETNFEGDPVVLKVERFRESQAADSLVYTLQHFQNEDLIIPAQAIVLQTGDRDTTLYTNRIPIFFKSSLQDTVSQFRPMKENYAFGSGIGWYALLFVLLLLAAALLWLYVQRRKASTSQEPRIYTESAFEDPLIILKSEIRILRQQTEFHSHEEADRFYVQLGDAIRAYIKRVYLFPALEMTSGEILTELAKQYASSGVIEKTRRVLMEADMVKFAKMTPDDETVESALQAADAFAETVERDDAARLEQMKMEHIETERIKKETFEKEGLT